MKEIGITTDCVCDMPDEYFAVNDIGVIYFYINTDTGRFRDVYEVTSENLIDYLENGGGKAITNAPMVSEYIDFFRAQLKKHNKLIHITISNKISMAYRNAVLAAEELKSEGKSIYVVDSKHLSTGIGYVVIRAVEMRDSGKNEIEIVDELINSVRDNVSTTFMARNANYLYRNGRVGRILKDICRLFNIHPILTMKNGEIKLKGVEIGEYGKASVRYVRKQLKNAKKIDTKRIFITHVGCNVKFLSDVKAEIFRCCEFEEVITTKASATISSNCGTGTFGVLFMNKY